MTVQNCSVRKADAASCRDQVGEARAKDTALNRDPSKDCESVSDSSDEGVTSSHNVELGRRGECAAAKFLERRGYEILERNWTCPAGEADIICHDGETIVFVEVKTRTSIEAGLPEEAVNKEKRSRYEKIAAYYLKESSYADIPVRFDVVGLLVIAPDRALIRHHIDAFGASL